ncbi:MAG: SDR family NAD(P)-dependent oxidoreductase [Puniceicoccaceae bacterium]
MSNNDLLKGKWALVTGSSRGIGRYIAKGLAEHSCNVIVHGRTLENTDSTLEMLSDYDVKAIAVAGELGNQQAEAALVAEVKKEVGVLDVLYNNAAVGSVYNEDLFSVTSTEWHRVFEVNLFSMVRICAAFIPGMMKQGWGRVINLTSGIADQPQLSPYAVSKGAVDRYSADLKTYLDGSGVIVSTLDPGWLKTDMGGENAEHEVDAVLPGALVPALLEDGSENGQFFRAQDYRK